MTATYDETKLALARNRVRFALRDVDMTAPKFADNEIDLALRDTGTKHFLWAFLRDDIGGSVTDGKIEIKWDDTEKKMKLVLSRTNTPAETANEFDLDDPRYDTFRELFDAVGKLGKGWQLGVHTQATIHWLFDYPDNAPVPRHVESLLARRSHDLMILPEISVWGSAKQQNIGLFDPEAATHKLRRLERDGVNSYQSYSEGDVSWTKAPDSEAGDKGKTSRTFAIPIY